MIKDMEVLLEKIISEIKERTDIAVIGLSGGADSTLIACLCLKALGKDNVYGIHLPYGETDRQKFNYRSQMLAKSLEIKDVLIPIGNICNMLDAHVGPAMQKLENPNFKYPTYKLNIVNAGNTRSRVRMCLLYSICHELGVKLEKRVRVVGTGNLSEDYAGYTTKGGDALADFFPIGQLFKSEVYQLLDYFRDSGLITEDLIDRVPSAGLWEGQRDLDELGYSYNEMEPAIKYLEDKGDLIELSTVVSVKTLEEKYIDPVLSEKFKEVCNFVKDRHDTTKHKIEAVPTFDLRKFCD